MHIKGIECQSTRQKIECQVQTLTCLDQALNLKIWFRASKHWIELHEDDLWHRQSQSTRDLARDQFSDQRLQPLTGSTKLEHIKSIIIRLNNCRKRATLTERGHITRCSNCSQHEAIV